MNFRVRWGDTDIAGVMHFLNHLRYVEVCEQEFYRSIGFTLNRVLGDYGVMFPRVEVSCEYKAECRFDEEIQISLEISEVESKTIKYNFQVTKKPDGKLAAEGYVKCIAVNRDWKPVDLPENLSRAVRATMKS